MNVTEQSLLSVIVPVFNVENFIKKCIESILAQTYQNLEIILVDDGSTDQSGTICDSFLKIDKRVRVIHQKNRGLSAARNAGIEIAKGEWISFVDGDDWIEKSMYMDMLSFAEETGKTDLVISGYRTVSVLNETIKIVVPKKKEIITGEEAIQRLFSEQDVLYISACVRLYSNHILKNIHFPEGKHFEDEYLAHELLFSCKRICIINKPLYVYLQRADSITHAQYDIRMLDQVEAYYHRYCFFKQKREERLVPLACIRFSDFYIESRKQFVPHNYSEKERVREIDRMAGHIIENEWNHLPLKVKVRLLAPYAYVMISRTREKSLLWKHR